MKVKIWRLGAVVMCGMVMWMAGCSPQNIKSNQETKKEDTEQETVTMDWYVNYSWFTATWGENLVSKEITKQTGVSIDFDTPSGDEDNKLAALISSNSLPELITLGWWEPQLDQLIQGDYVYALNELADEYDAYFWEVSNPEIINWYTQEDGNIYCYPNSAVTPSDFEKYENLYSNQAFLVRKDIYEAIGSPDMTTTEGFKSAVETAAKMFPEVDGYPLIPIGSQEQVFQSFDRFLMNFLAIPFEKDGQYYDRYTDEEYIRWLKMFRELYEEGLLTQDVFIDKTQQISEKIGRGQYFCMLYQYTDMEEQQKMLYEKDPNMIYIAVDGPTNKNGDPHTLTVTNANGWTVTLVSKKCEHPDKAIELISYMLSEEGQKVLSVGIEGETYDMVGQTAVPKPEVQEMLEKDWQKYNQTIGADDMYWMLMNPVMQSEWTVEKPEYIRQIQEWTKPYTVYNGQYDSIFKAGTREAELDDQITKLWEDTLPELLSAPSEEEFDRILENYIEKRQQYGFEDYIKTQTEMMKEAKQKLRIRE